LVFATIGLGIVTALGIRNQSRDTKIIQRAYLSVEPYGIAPWVSFGSQGKSADEGVAHFGIHNRGNLPATKVRWFVDMAFSSNHQLRETDMKLGEYVGDGIVIPQRVVIRQGGPHRPFESEDFAYVWGKVVYNDGFVDGRSITFCHRYNMKRLTVDEESGQKRLQKKYGRFHEYGNHTDEA
jgi:hypothetical protein